MVFQGAIQGPEEFVEGMALGVKALVGGAVGKHGAACSCILFNIFLCHLFLYALKAI